MLFIMEMRVMLRTCCSDRAEIHSFGWIKGITCYAHSNFFRQFPKGRNQYVTRCFFHGRMCHLPLHFSRILSITCSSMIEPFFLLWHRKDETKLPYRNIKEKTSVHEEDSFVCHYRSVMFYSVRSSKYQLTILASLKSEVQKLYQETL